MARPKKYPAFPGQGEKEVPYDTEHFKMWCVEEEGMSEQSANVYVCRIRKAFEVVFDGEYRIFEILSQAFQGYIRHPEICLKNLEMASGYLKDLIDLMAKLPAQEYFEFKKLAYKPKTLKEWVSAFSTYHRYYEYRIDKLRINLGIPAKSPDSKKDRMIPLKKEFSTYLKQECRYNPDSVWSHVSYLTKLKYFMLDFIVDDDIFEVVLEEDIDWESIKPIFQDSIRLVELEIKMIDKNLPDHFSVNLSVKDLKRGKIALEKYRDFIKYRIKNNFKGQTQIQS